jgi:hypothetical protein
MRTLSSLLAAGMEGHLGHGPRCKTGRHVVQLPSVLSKLFAQGVERDGRVKAEIRRGPANLLVRQPLDDGGAVGRVDIERGVSASLGGRRLAD